MDKIFSDKEYLALAVTEARKGANKTWQNPQVGAVIVKDGRVLATGYHHQFGQQHAEINALSHLVNMEQARGATMYVTLEPCCHTGKTPPCAKRLVDVGIRQVVIGQLDPNPIVSGKGVKLLQAGGVDVKLANFPMTINHAYNSFYQQQRPLITVKYAMSLDGKINKQTGKRTLLTGYTAWLDSQHLRAQQQAILVGEHTLLVDDPELTVRQEILLYPPIRIVVVHDVNLLSSQLMLFKGDAPVWILSQTPLKQSLPGQSKVFVNAEWTPQAIIALLTKKGIQSLLVEGGSHLQAEFISQQLIDQLVVYIAPKLLGGGGLPAVAGTPLPQLIDFKQFTVEQVGADLRVSSRREV
ncbi:bifunctional diaminohydroxyphosphoribosylaminopyrimidine deaminase/5-amino-6-(5-phosphoribosylamino)uracil reductase RibD [Loigolactobacillus jiayinensis]|uniref:Riboflavin biosynthesis protein RibD n=1 Tax=Loigolactobacillus jiayinensis TaxID=2486016 RepID=A0ABW1RDE3_9LACO|nr:bifunctional diaminohydroxyphosphoribosylaminopyrimidine deaminase/5-amino-6-(5-phosphoribosylamino)uracil reductase RibD [Loigolactobacillus jiayinensis]